MSVNPRHLPPPRILTAADLALMLDVGVPQARRLLRQRRLPGVKISGRWYISREAVVDRIEHLSGVDLETGRP